MSSCDRMIILAICAKMGWQWADGYRSFQKAPRAGNGIFASLIHDQSTRSHQYDERMSSPRACFKLICMCCTSLRSILEHCLSFNLIMTVVRMQSPFVHNRPVADPVRAVCSQLKCFRIPTHQTQKAAARSPFPAAFYVK